MTVTRLRIMHPGERNRAAPFGKAGAQRETRDEIIPLSERERSLRTRKSCPKALSQTSGHFPEHTRQEPGSLLPAPPPPPPIGAAPSANTPPPVRRRDQPRGGEKAQPPGPRAPEEAGPRLVLLRQEQKGSKGTGRRQSPSCGSVPVPVPPPGRVRTPKPAGARAGGARTLPLHPGRLSAQRARSPARRGRRRRRLPKTVATRTVSAK